MFWLKIWKAYPPHNPSTSSSVNHKNRRWYHDLVQSLNIELWLRLHERWYGFDHFLKNSASYLLFQCLCIVIIKLLSSSLEIPLFLSVQSTMILTATTFKIMLCPDLFLRLMWHHIISLSASSQRVWPRSHMMPSVPS